MTPKFKLDKKKHEDGYSKNLFMKPEKTLVTRVET